MSSTNFNLMLITNSPDIALHAVKSGVNRIFVDLEINGKFARQGHLDTVISRHCMSDITAIRNVIGDSQLLVRLNPFYDGSELEINEAIDRGADIIMLPMFRKVVEVEFFSKIINKRAKFIPLVETIDAINILKDIVQIEGVSEVYIGLNDLHREMNLKFMFQPLLNSNLDKYTEIISNAGLPFGFGGVARVGEGMLPAEMVLSEHVRLNSSAVILSRTFHRNANTLDELLLNIDLSLEIKKIRDAISTLRTRNEKSILHDKNLLDNTILKIING